MRQTFFLVFSFFLITCGNNTGNNDTVKEALIDSSLIESKIDWLFQKKTINFPVKYKMDIFYFYPGNTTCENWYLDSNLDIINLQTDWYGEGYTGKNIETYKNNTFLYSIDSTFSNETIEVSLLFSNPDDIKGINVIYEYNDTENTYSETEKTFDNTNLKRVIKRFLYQESIDKKQRNTINKFEDIKNKIREYKDSVTYVNGLARFKNNNNDESSDYLIDSVLFNRMLEDEK